VQAHTGSLAGSDAVVDEVFRRLGVVRLDSLNELLETAELFNTCPMPEGEGVGLLSLSGGQLGLVGDLAEDLSLALPKFSDGAVEALAEILPPFTNITNPLDAWGTGDLEKTYPGCVEVVANEPHIHVVAMTKDTPPTVADREVEQGVAVAQAAAKAARDTGKPVLLFSNISAGLHGDVKQVLDEAGVAYLEGTRETLRAVQAFTEYGTFLRSTKETPERGCASPADLAAWRERLGQVQGGLSEIEGRELLAAYGIQGPREGVAATAEDAMKQADSIGYPVVLKIHSPDIQHKTEMGGVRVGLESAAEVSQTFDEVMAAAKKFHPDARLEGVIIQEMIPSDAVEVLLGILRDPDFGPVVVFGSGGILVELVKDSALRLPPLSHDEALAMIEETRGAKLLRGFRGRPPADVDALADTLMRFSQLAADLGDLIAAVDINPLMVLPAGQGVRAVDALVELG
jgi:acetyltransferase